MTSPVYVIQGFFAGGWPRVAAARARTGAVQPSRPGVFPLSPALSGIPARTPGQPLPPAVQRRMEQAFGMSFSDVRIHIGPEAASIGALAFTLGSQVYFAPGQYNPHHPHGQRLIAHELAHVVQQRSGRVRNPSGAGIAIVQDPHLEAEAERMASRLGALPARRPVLASRVQPVRKPPAAAGRGRAAVQRRAGPVSPQPVAPHVRAALGGIAVQRQARPGSGGVVQCALTEDRKIELKLIAKSMPGFTEARAWFFKLNLEEQQFVNEYYDILISLGFWPPQPTRMEDEENIDVDLDLEEDDDISIRPPACAPLTVDEAKKIFKYKLGLRVGKGANDHGGACYALSDFGDEYWSQQQALSKIQWILKINGTSGRQWGDLLGGTILNIAGLERADGSHLILLSGATSGSAERYPIYGTGIVTLAKIPKVPTGAKTESSIVLGENLDLSQIVRWVRQAIANLQDPGNQWF